MNKPTFTERTAALMRLSSAGLIPHSMKELLKDMAAAIDALQAK
jgi:hypothetical protein